MSKQSRFLEVPTDQLKPFPLNPRRIQNREYVRLSDSILHSGVTLPFVVSKIPGDEHYTLQAGGNTRLEIIQSLRERDGRKFKKVPCVVQSWSGETNALIAHLQENDVRGNLLFIEKAQAVMTLQEMLKRDLKKKNMTQRELSTHLRDRGYGISQSLISFMEYAVKRLYPVLPVALDTGMGRNTIHQIRTLEKSASAIWSRHSDDESEQTFANLFDELCKRHDQIEFSFDEFKDDVVNELLQETDVDLHTIKWMIEEQSEGRESTFLEVDQALPNLVNQVSDIEQERTDGSRERAVPNAKNWMRQINRYRNKMANAAIEIANEFDMAHCTKTTEGVGLGYVMVDIPAKTASRSELLVWKLLASCCEQTKLNKPMLCPQLKRSSRLMRQAESSRLSEIYGGFPKTDLFETFPKLRTFIGNDCWSKIVELVTSYACIARIANEHSIDLWEGK